MAAVPVTIQCMVYPRNKTVAPYPATIVGMASITGLEIGGGPIVEPPPDITPEPPLVIWGPPDGRPTLPISGWDPGSGTWPDQPPPDQPPTAPEKPHEGWNWSAAKSQWYYLYVPGKGAAQPKK